MSTTDESDSPLAMEPAAASALLHGLVDRLVPEHVARRGRMASPVTADVEEIRAWLDRYPLQRPGDLDAAVPKLLKALADWTVHTDHPGYFGLFNPTSTWPGIAADLIASVVNPAARGVEPCAIRR